MQIRTQTIEVAIKMRLKCCKPISENMGQPLKIAELIEHIFQIKLRGLEYYLNLFLSNQEYMGCN